MTVEETLLQKLLDHSYIQEWDGKMGTYPPFEITAEELEVFRKFRETGMLFGKQVGYRNYTRTGFGYEELVPIDPDEVQGKPKWDGAASDWDASKVSE